MKPRSPQAHTHIHTHTHTQQTGQHTSNPPTEGAQWRPEDGHLHSLSGGGGAVAAACQCAPVCALRGSRPPPATLCAPAGPQWRGEAAAAAAAAASRRATSAAAAGGPAGTQRAGRSGRSGRCGGGGVRWCRCGCDSGSARPQQAQEGRRPPRGCSLRHAPSPSSSPGSLDIYIYTYVCTHECCCMEGGGVLKQGCHSGLQLQRTPSWTPVCVCVCVCALGFFLGGGRPSERVSPGQHPPLTVSFSPHCLPWAGECPH